MTSRGRAADSLAPDRFRRLELPVFVVAHLSDLHFNGTVHNRARIEAALQYVNSRADGIDALLITGDIADTGTAEQYREARAVLTSPLPTLITIGNHDDRSAFEDVLGLPANSVLDVESVDGRESLRLIAVDSSLPDEAGGYLDDDTLAWLDARIGATDAPVLVAFHHPPVVLHMPVMDAIAQRGGERLGALLSRHGNVAGLLCGHAHTPAVTTFAGLPLCLAPGVSSTLNLPFEGPGVINTGQPPAVAFHLLDDERLTTHFRVAT